MGFRDKQPPDYQAMSRAQLQSAFQRLSDKHTRLMRKFDKHDAICKQALAEAQRVSAGQEIMLAVMEQRHIDSLMSGNGAVH